LQIFVWVEEAEELE